MFALQNQPRFLMQVNRQQPVPKLVSINETPSHQHHTFSSQKGSMQTATLKQKSVEKEYRNVNPNFYDSRQNESSLQDNQNAADRLSVNFGSNSFTSSNMQNQKAAQKQQNVSASGFFTTVRKQLPVTEPRNYRIQVIQLQKLLEIQKQEKLELQQIIKQLTVQSQKLKELNEHIVQRLKELEKNFVEQKISQEKEQENRVRKSICQVYQDVEMYIRTEVEGLTKSLKGEKMTPLLQKKLQLFLESMLQINQNTVQMHKISAHRNSTPNRVLQPFISSTLDEKENLTRSNVALTNHLSLLFDEKRKNQSFLGNSPKRGKDISPRSRSGRKLINNAYITSKKKESPKRVLFGGSVNKQTYPQEYSTILKQLDNTEEDFQPDFGRESPQKIFEDQEEKSRFNTNAFQTNNRNRNNSRMEESYAQRKKYYQTSNYQEANFRIKEYTPSKRKRIFDGKTKSQSKRYDTHHY